MSRNGDDEREQTSGYVTDTAYTESFFRELAPVWLSYVAALNGVAVRELDTPFTYLELGCGYGHSTLLHAAAYPHATFHACDINPTHIASARHAAAAFQISNVHFHEESFAGLLVRELPDCDFIVLHGVYSWVDADDRNTVREILRRKLQPGGLAYVSYNSLPGWAAEAPLRKLLIELAASRSGNSAQRSEQALHSLLQLGEGSLQYLSANPLANTALASYQRGQINYLVHEFMNRSWQPFYGVDVADELQQAGLTYVGSATLAENHPMLLMDERTAALIAALDSERQRRLATDYATNQRFRRDVFVRGEPQRVPADAPQPLATALIGCQRGSALDHLTLRVPRGELTLQADFMRELREVLSHGPVSMAQAASALHRAGRDPMGITRNLLFLIAGGALQPCASPARPAQEQQPRRYASETLQRMMAQIIERGTTGVLPSPVLGNGLKIEPLEARVIDAIVQGASNVTDHELQCVRDDLLPALLQLGILR